MCVAALCAAPFGGSAAYGQSTLPTPTELRAAGLEMAWWAVAAVPAGQDRVQYLTADEDAVYVQTDGNLLTAIDLTTGAKKWVTRIGREGQTATPVGTTAVIDEGPGVEAAPAMVIACIGRSAYALRKDTGEILWTLPLPAAAAAAATIGPTDEGRRLFVPSGGGSVYSFNLETIEDFNLEKRLDEFATGTQLWRFETGAPLVGPVALDGIAAVFANEKGVMYGVEAERRDLLWRFETAGRTTAPIVAADGVAYIASSDRNLYAVDITNGLDRWEFVSQEPVEKTPAIVKGSVFVTPGRGGVARVDRDTGRPIWQAPRTTGFLAQAADRVYVSDNGDNVIALDLKDGRPIGSIRLNRFPLRVQNPLTDRVIVSTNTGIVLCLKAAGTGYPVYYANPDRRPVEPSFAGDEPAGDAPEAAAGDADPTVAE
ncbi:Outer membrane protein assembly factor BamB [Planctomycetes bacterium LzC2]|uniref:Outer membrane protein assembly factor BamB n=2 Tax=Alienimonas chondri TaxID=2681879 RepID=A0ABX1VDH1_9PLAN|nr:Outer membrane protein assembly factor BamB [Alienimonas chondri]